REGIIRSRAGSADLEPETSDSWTVGLVWSPSSWLDLSLDWFDIDMRNQVQDLRVQDVMINERDCRLGTLDIDSPICVDTLARITRMPDGTLYGVHVKDRKSTRLNSSHGESSYAVFCWKTRTTLSSAA